MRSYRDLPMRLGETSTLFRNEDSGEMHGLIRVRQFTSSEGHIICTPEQLKDEFKNSLELAKFMLESVGLAEDIDVTVTVAGQLHADSTLDAHLGGGLFGYGLQEG